MARLVNDVWRIECGVWRMVYGVWRVAGGILRVRMLGYSQILLPKLLLVRERTTMSFEKKSS